METASLNLPENAVIDWKRSEVSIGLSDSRGIQQPIRIRCGAEQLDTEPGTVLLHTIRGGVHAPVDLSDKQQFSFETRIALNGSQSMQVVPLGKRTRMDLTTHWDKPKYLGAFIPDSHDISNGIARAHWEVLHFNRDYPQIWVDERPQTLASSMGLELLPTIQHYHKTHRSLEYALLIIALTFAAFFLYEVLQGKRLHPIQYTLVGFALVVFYLLLISFTEYLAFPTAYLIASGTVIMLSASYFASITRKRKAAFGMGVLMVVLYAFLYVVLSSEDYALLIGSIGLLIALSAIMYATRKVDWYALTQSSNDDSNLEQK